MPVGVRGKNTGHGKRPRLDHADALSNLPHYRGSAD